MKLVEKKDELYVYSVCKCNEGYKNKHMNIIIIHFKFIKEQICVKQEIQNRHDKAQ